MSDLATFLLARIAEDEEQALTAAGWDRSGRERASGRWSRTGISSLEDDERRPVIYSDNNQLSGDVADHIVRWDPARVLAECETQRRIVELHQEDGVHDCVGMDWSQLDPGPCPTLRLLALPYAAHDGYREEWRP